MSRCSPSISDGSFLLSSQFPLHLLNVLLVWVENRVVLRLGSPSNIYVMWCTLVYKKKRKTEETGRKREGWPKEKQRQTWNKHKKTKSDRKWASQTKKQTERVKLRKGAHRETKSVKERDRQRRRRGSSGTAQTEESLSERQWVRSSPNTSPAWPNNASKDGRDQRRPWKRFCKVWVWQQNSICSYN